MKHILAVDDDASIRDLIADYLGEQGFRVTTVADGAHLLKTMESDPADLVLLDVRLPGEDGFSLARTLREGSGVPIIMLTGQTHEIDRVLGLELGADDYLTKPFSPRELLARIRAVLRHYQPASAENDSRRADAIRSYKFSGWSLATGTRKLTAPDGRNVELTNGEFALLVTFLKSPRRVLSRDQLLAESRLHDDVFDRSIDVQILRLRRKIEADPNDPKLIRTERGAGYRFDSDVKD
ncbi:MAG: response regulator [Betaproteobacteria bacterium]|nr:response regulator [Betaproteobacteria bacterium]